MNEENPHTQIIIIKEPTKGEYLEKVIAEWATINNQEIRIKIADNREKIFQMLGIVRKKIFGIFAVNKYNQGKLNTSDIIIAGSQIRGSDPIKVYPILKKMSEKPFIITVSQDEKEAQSLYNALGGHRVIRGSELAILQHVQKALTVIESMKSNSVE